MEHSLNHADVCSDIGFKDLMNWRSSLRRCLAADFLAIVRVLRDGEGLSKRRGLEMVKFSRKSQRRGGEVELTVNSLGYCFRSRFLSPLTNTV